MASLLLLMLMLYCYIPYVSFVNRYFLYLYDESENIFSAMKESEKKKKTERKIKQTEPKCERVSFSLAIK